MSKKLTRDEKIGAICDSIEGWDLDTLIECAKEWRATMLRELSSADIDRIYQDECVPPPKG